jgi:hypothetical protein
MCLLKISMVVLLLVYEEVGTNNDPRCPSRHGGNMESEGFSVGAASVCTLSQIWPQGMEELQVGSWSLSSCVGIMIH